MSVAGDTLTDKKRRLIDQIARQRGELAYAYGNMSKPLLYTEYAMRGYGLLRQNPWVLSVIPAGMSIFTALVGLVRRPKAPRGKLKWLARDAERNAARTAERAGLGSLAVKWGGRGWKLFRLYGRLRKFFL